MGNVWFTGDTHFGHERTRQLSKRPFNSIEEMDNVMISNWNNVVAEDDIVYHIGDFGDYKKSFLLNGNIILLLGNYERNDIDKKIITLDELKKNFKFKDVIDDTCLSITVFDENQQKYQFDLVHEPSHRDINTFTLFGHIHKLQMIKKNALNVGVDCHNFVPIDLETVLFYKNAIEHHYDFEVFMQ